MPENKKFWKFCNQAGNKVELLLYGDISQTSWWGDEVTPKQFAEELAGLGALDEITVRINSGGGDVFAAQAIGNQLEQHPAAVTAKIDGLCASAATIVACHWIKPFSFACAAVHQLVSSIHPATSSLSLPVFFTYRPTILSRMAFIASHPTLYKAARQLPPPAL